MTLVPRSTAVHGFASKGAPLNAADHDANLAHFADRVGSGRGLVPIERFGIYPRANTTVVDRTTAFQAALDSAAGSGDHILISRGVIDLTYIRVPTMGGIVGTSMYGSVLRQVPGSTTTMLDFNSPAANGTGDLSGNGSGNLISVLENMTLNGAHYLSTSNVEPLLRTRTGNDDLGHETLGQSQLIKNTLLHDRGFVDPNRRFRNLYITDAYDGMMLEGRSGSMYEGIHIRNPTRHGIVNRAFDELWSNVHVTAPGGVGVLFQSPSGEIRMLNAKVYFTGQNSTRSDGDGFRFEQNVGAIYLTNCCAQDTHRHGYNLEHAYGVQLRGCAAREIGALRPVFGMGNETIDPNISAVRLANAIDCRADVDIGYRFTKWMSMTSATQWGANFATADARRCVIDLMGDPAEFIAVRRDTNSATHSTNRVTHAGDVIAAT
jgi:hypothetical protein